MQRFYTDTSAVVHMTHQVVDPDHGKTETYLGLLSLMTEAIGIEQFSHIQEDLAEVIVMQGILRGLLRAAEADAAPNAYGVYTPAWEPLNTARNWYPRASQRLPETRAQVRRERAHGDSHRSGTSPAGPPTTSSTYLQSATLIGPERVRLFRLAWDASISSFAGRQTCTSTTSSATRCEWPARC